MIPRLGTLQIKFPRWYRQQALLWAFVDFILCLGIMAVASGVLQAADGLDVEKQAMQKQLAEVDRSIAADGVSVALLSRRGDLRFFLGQFPDAVSDYEQMVALQPDLDTSHWRRGIAYFVVGRYKDAARQFEVYHSFDDVDRENGIWRFLSQYRAFGKEKAAEGLLKYAKDDREPFPAIYAMFEGKREPDDVLAEIRGLKISPEQKSARLFYAELYVGLLELAQNDQSSALKHLQAAVAIDWPREAGFGPNYMWHVARLQRDQLVEELRKAGKQ